MEMNVVVFYSSGEQEQLSPMEVFQYLRLGSDGTVNFDGEAYNERREDKATGFTFTYPVGRGLLTPQQAFDAIRRLRVFQRPTPVSSMRIPGRKSALSCSINLRGCPSLDLEPWW